MKCPYCNEADTKVIDSRPAEDNKMCIRDRLYCEHLARRCFAWLEHMRLAQNTSECAERRGFSVAGFRSQRIRRTACWRKRGFRSL